MILNVVQHFIILHLNAV